MVSQTLGHYRILEKLGGGGMGEVYRAEDSTLDRQVALKVLPPELAQHQERLDRFQREAKTLAALDHPNIVHIHTVEESEGIHFLTMQLVEGKPLSELIPTGGMSLERIFDLAIPLADALATAHEKGIIHRDLKPANIMVTDEERVKVLDFGLAKLRQEAKTPVATQLPTEPLTEEGRVVGTVPYMSPEQVEGKPVDHRSDLFSFGIILYEMATGQRPFQGVSPASVMSAILRDTPSSVIELSPSLPRELAKIIRRCLVKDPERRFQTARELAIELDELRSEVASGEAWESVSRPPTRRRVGLWGGIAAAGTVLVAALAVLMWVLLSNQKRSRDETRPRTTTFAKLVFDASRKGKVSASPDGRFFVYASDASGNWDIYLRRIQGGNAINLTEDSPADDHQPSFSSDGESIAFRSERDGGGIYIMGATGESVRRVVNGGFHPDWSPEGAKIVFSTSRTGGGAVGDIDERISIVNLTTGEVVNVLDRSAVMPAWSPNGWRISYWGIWKPSEAEEQIGLFTVIPDGGEPVFVTSDAGSQHAWSPDGRSLYYVSGRGGSRDLWRIPIDEVTGRTRGDPLPITSGSTVSSVSPSGDGKRILYSSRQRFREILRVPFDPVGETVTGPAMSITQAGIQAMFPSVSPDGEWIAFSAHFGQVDRLELGVIRQDGTSLKQLTDTGTMNWFPQWSPDGQHLAFFDNDIGSGTEQIWVIRADGGGLRRLTDASAGVSTPLWSPDGSQLAAHSAGGETTYIIQVGKPWDAATAAHLPPIGDSEDRFEGTSWSPDGKSIAGVRWRVGAAGLDVQHVALYSFEAESYRSFPEPLGTNAWVIWLNDSRRLMVSSGELDERSRLYILDTESGDTREVLSSEALSAAPDLHTGRLVFPAISPDNQSLYLDWRYSQRDIWMLTLGEQE